MDGVLMGQGVLLPVMSGGYLSPSGVAREQFLPSTLPAPTAEADKARQYAPLA